MLINTFGIWHTKRKVFCHVPLTDGEENKIELLLSFPFPESAEAFIDTVIPAEEREYCVVKNNAVMHLASEHVVKYIKALIKEGILEKTADTN